MRFEEFLVLYIVGTGSSSLEEIAFKSDLQPKHIEDLIKSLKGKGSLTKEDHKLSLSKRGLLEFSRHTMKSRCEVRKYYLLKGKLSYFLYNNEFTKDAIFHPDLYFEAVTSEDFSKQFMYEIVLENLEIDVDLLEALYNLLDKGYTYEATGFWILKCHKRNVCGWGIKNLRKSLHLLKPYQLIFLIGSQDFVILLSSILKDGKIKEPQMKVYFTREIYPYIDSIDSLSKQLQPLLNFIDIPKLPRGKEIQSEVNPYWLELESFPPRFALKVLGKIGFRDITYDSREIFPSIVVTDPSNVKSNLNKVSPWFVTSSRGFIAEDSRRRTKFYLHYFDVLSLPDIDVVTLMLG